MLNNDFGDNHTVIMDVDKKAYLSALASLKILLLHVDSSFNDI